jgi:hypothetical protein
MVKKIWRYWPLAIVLAISGFTIYQQISLDRARHRRQAENTLVAGNIEENLNTAKQLIKEADPEAKNVTAVKHLILADHYLFSARLENDVNGYCYSDLSDAKYEINLALKEIGRSWEFDDKGRKEKEREYYVRDRKEGESAAGELQSIKSFNYGSDGVVTSTVSKFPDGQVRAEDFFVNGKQTASRHYMGGCGVGRVKWKPETAIITVYAADGQTKLYRQYWELDEDGKMTGLLGGLTEYVTDNTPKRDWAFGVFVTREEDDPALAGKVPTQLESWKINPTRLVVEHLRPDGSVSKRTTFQHSDDLNAKPQEETFKGSEGGVRKVDPALMRYPAELFKY